MIGVQVGAALKNVITIGIGMLDGAGYTDNAKAFLFTRGLHEMVQLCVAMGGKQQTMYGLSGVGDLLLTSLGPASKNRQVAIRLGSGESLDQILADTGFIPEGINTLGCMQELATRYAVELPISCGLHHVVCGKKTIATLLHEQMARPFEWECQ